MRHILMAAAILASVLCTAHAWAHAFLKTATPAVGSTVGQAPRQVLIVFTEGVEPAFSSITITDQTGARVDSGTAHLVGGNTQLAIDLKPLQPGPYRVAWHATATDTHRTDGTFSFTVEP